MPRSTYQRVRSSIQYWCSSSSVPGSTKYSISICSNSRVRKMKLPGVISLRKLLPIWPMPNGGLLPRRRLHVEEVHEDALRGLRAQVVQALLGLHRAEVGLEHHVEVARRGVLAAGAAVGARHVGQVVLGRRLAGALGVLLGELVGAEALVAVACTRPAGRGTRCTWPGGHPDLAGQDHRAVEADDVLAAGDHRLPPLPLDVLLELDAQGPVVPRRAGAAVDLAGGEDEPAALAQRDDGVDLGGRGFAGHGRHSTIGRPESPSVPSACRDRRRLPRPVDVCHPGRVAEPVREAAVRATRGAAARRRRRAPRLPAARRAARPPPRPAVAVPDRDRHARRAAARHRGTPTRAQAPDRYRALVGGLHTRPPSSSTTARSPASSCSSARSAPARCSALPAGELAGLDLPATDLLGRLGDDLHEQMRAHRHLGRTVPAARRGSRPPRSTRPGGRLPRCAGPGTCCAPRTAPRGSPTSPARSAGASATSPRGSAPRSA